MTETQSPALRPRPEAVPGPRGKRVAKVGHHLGSYPRKRFVVWISIGIIEVDNYPEVFWVSFGILPAKSEY